MCLGRYPIAATCEVRGAGCVTKGSGMLQIVLRGSKYHHSPYLGPKVRIKEPP